MITNLLRYPAHLCEGFSGEYSHPDGHSVSFSLCLHDPKAAPKQTKEKKRQTLIEAKKRAAAESAPQVYAMSEGLNNINLASGIKQALQDTPAGQPVFIEVSHHAMFAKACEVLGMSRKALIDLASSVFVSQAEQSKQAYGGFHRLLGQIYDQRHLPISNLEDYTSLELQHLDARAYDYATSMSADLKRVLPGAQKYVLQFGLDAHLKHMDGELGRYFAPQNVTAIEVKFATAEGKGHSAEITYTLVLMPPQFSKAQHDFDVAVILERDKTYSLFPAILSVHPNDQLNNIDCEYRPYVSVNVQNVVSGDQDRFNRLCDKFMFIALSSLEWINSPNAKRVAHEPKQKQSVQPLCEQFAVGGKRPFFSTVEIKIPTEGDDVPSLHKAQHDGVHSMKGCMGLQSVTAHFQRYQGEKRFKQPYERGSPEYGATAHIGVGIQGQTPA